MREAALRFGLAAGLLGVAAPAAALQWELEAGGGLTVEWLNTLSVGAAWRMEAPEPDLIGKASLPENRQLCAADDCISVSESNTEPAERHFRARGALSSYADDANLNYGKGDLIAATGKWSTRLNLRWKKFGLDLSGLYFYDNVNTGFIEFHPNRIVTPGPQPGVFTTTRRDAQAEEQIGNAFELRNANVYTRLALPWGGDVGLRAGRQLLTWGVSAFGVNGSLNFVNAPDLNALTRPGFELFELYRPQGMVTLNANLTENLGMEGFYQYEWLPVGLPPKGSFFSFFDAGSEIVADDHIPLPFGKTPEDPGQLQTPASPLVALVTATSFAARRAPNREPEDGGQYGLALHYFFDNLGVAGTEFSLYLARYHSRIPAASFFASEASCTRREGNANNHDTTNFLEFQTDCGIPGVQQPGVDFEALPVDTARYFLDYAEDIKLVGVSFSTQLFGAAIQGELAYRPNQPVQVDLEDLFFAALQPTFPRNTIEIVPGVATLASSRRAIPDFVTAYRGGTPGEVVPRSYIRGYEPMKTWFTSLGFLKIWGPDFVLRADQFGVLFEANAVYLPDLPRLSELQFEGPATFTHASPGTLDTGDGLRFNPIRNTDGYVTDFSLGYRLGALMLYNNVLRPGLSLRPLVVLIHDVKGVAPGLAEIVLEGRKIILANVEAKTGPWSLNLQYGVFTGAGRFNTLRDRDVFGLALSYDF